MEEKCKWLKKLSIPPHFWHGFRSLKTKVYLLSVPVWVPPTKGDPPVTATWCHRGEERPSPTLCEQDSPFLCWTWVQSVHLKVDTNCVAIWVDRGTRSGTGKLQKQIIYIRRPRQTQGGARQGIRHVTLFWTEGAGAAGRKRNYSSSNGSSSSQPRVAEGICKLATAAAAAAAAAAGAAAAAASGRRS